MYRESLRESKPSNQLFFALLVIVICALAVMILSVALVWLFFGVNPSQLGAAMQDLSNPNTISLLKFIQILQAIGVFILPPFIVAWFLHPNPRQFLHFQIRPDLISIIFVVAIVMVSNPLINWLTEINSKLSFPSWLKAIEIWMQNSENQANQITEAFLSTTSVSSLLINLGMVAILPAIGEELLFRGIVQQLFKKILKNAHIAIWVSAIIFSAVHLQFYGFLPRMLLGAMFGYMLEWSGTIWLPILAHFVNNATAVIGYFLMHKEVIGNQIEKAGTSTDESSYLAAISLTLLIFFFRALYLKRIKQNDENPILG